MDNNLGDFFRKKLDDLDSLDKNWDKPDAAIKMDVLEKITSSKKQNQKYFLLIFISFLGLLVSSAGFYVWNLKQENKNLKKNLAITTTLLKQANNRISLLEKEKNKNVITQKKETSIYKTKVLKQPITVQPTTILKLNNDNQVLKIGTNSNATPTFSTTTPSTDPIKILSSENQNRIIDNMESLPNIPLQTLSIASRKLPTLYPELTNSIIFHKNKKRFEITANLGFSNTQIPLKLEYEDFSSGKSYSQTEIFHSLKPNFTMTYSPRKNWWFSLGFQASNMKLVQKLTFDAMYDKTKEYIHTNGNVSNNMILKSTGGYINTESNIRVGVPQGANFENGDAMIVEFMNVQEITMNQIPIGIEYRHEKNKLQWSLQSGFQWNKMHFNTYELNNPKITVNNKDLSIDNIEVLKEKDSKQFFNLYGGIGLQYQLNQHWSIKANMLYNYNFHLQTKDLRIGIGYQF